MSCSLAIETKGGKKTSFLPSLHRGGRSSKNGLNMSLELCVRQSNSIRIMSLICARAVCEDQPYLAEHPWLYIFWKYCPSLNLVSGVQKGNLHRSRPTLCENPILGGHNQILGFETLVNIKSHLSSLALCIPYPELILSHSRCRGRHYSSITVS